MKIILATGIYPPEIGGPATYAQGLARALAARGHEVAVVAYGDSSDYDEDGFRVVRVSRSGGPLVRYLRYAFRVWLLARKTDVVYAQGPTSEGLPASVGARLARRPLVMKVVGDYAWEIAQQSGERVLLDGFLEHGHGGRIGLLEKIERWTARRAAAIITPSKYLKSVVQRWGVPSEKIEVVLNASDLLPQTRGRELERQALGVNNKVVVLTAVRAVPWKGVGELIAWWKDVPSSHLLVIAGDGPELSRWKKIADENGVSDRLRFLGRTSRVDLARWYDAADAFVLPSGYEGYPNVVSEAASRGVPCLVSDRGGNPETRETFPELVKVIPYLDSSAWVAAVSSVAVRSADAQISQSPSWTHPDMVSAAERVLSEASRPTAVTVGYERAFLDPSSDAAGRALSLAKNGWRIRALVIGRQGADAGYVSDDFAAYGFHGSPLRRIWKTLLTGIREARSAPGRSIVAAQDPFGAGLVGYLISRLSGAPLEIQEHGDFFSGEWERERITHHASLENGYCGGRSGYGW